mmetsp:Transcript_10346/g.18303  ORF Transcript_10346/g.18303 Transcript_10346/m.18303 type:complete len:212 (-) Transcript_10346:412-1047(-)
MTTKDESSTLAARNGGVPAGICQWIFILFECPKLRDFLVGTDIPQTNRSVFRTSGKGVVVTGEKIHAIDVTLVTCKRLLALLGTSNIPQLDGLVDTATQKAIGIVGTQGQEHGIGLVFGKGIHDSAAGNVPTQTGGVSAGRQYLIFVQKSTATQEPIVRGHFLSGLGRNAVGRGGRGGIDLVDGAQIVQSTAGDEFSVRRFHPNGHDVTRL